MGTDKAMLDFRGKPLILHALEQFSGFTEILISAADTDLYAFTGFTIVPDESPGMGPLGGFISVLKAASFESVCFRPVDAPFVPHELHTILASACAGKDAVVPVYNGYPEPLLACLSKSSLPILDKFAAEGEYKAAAVFPLLDTYYVDLDAPEIFTAFGDPAEYLVNANDPDTFSKLRKRL